MLVLHEENGVLDAAGDPHHLLVREGLDQTRFEHDWDEVIEKVGVGLHTFVEVLGGERGLVLSQLLLFGFEGLALLHVELPEFDVLGVMAEFTLLACAPGVAGAVAVHDDRVVLAHPDVLPEDRAWFNRVHLHVLVFEPRVLDLEVLGRPLVLEVVNDLGFVLVLEQRRDLADVLEVPDILHAEVAVFSAQLAVVVSTAGVELRALNVDDVDAY